MDLEKNKHLDTMHYVWERNYSRRLQERRNVCYIAYPIEKERRVNNDRRIGIFDRRRDLA